MTFRESLKFIPLFLVMWECCVSYAYVSIRSEEIAGKLDDDLSESKPANTTPVVVQAKNLRSDEFSMFDEDVKNMPEYKGGLLNGLLTQKGRKKKPDKMPKSHHKKTTRKDSDVPGTRESNRIRRDVTDDQDTDSVNSYKEWESWSDCSSDNCNVEGIKTRHRSCYTFDSTQTETSACTYENLVQQERCFPKQCSFSHDMRWSEWSVWSSCDITCGKGGSQSRQRFCTHGNGTIIKTKGTCAGTNSENRRCQYLSSCPQWDAWEEWSQCSESCGKDGFTTRKRNCVFYRHGVTPSADNTFIHETSGSGKENTGHLNLTQTPEGPIFVVDASADDEKSVSEQDLVKERAHEELCSRSGDENSEEIKKCSFRGNCSSWTLWGAWSSCHRGCAPGFRRRERECNKNDMEEPCSGGYKTQYRRCYPPPCWGRWAEVGSCSATCGKGQQTRIRRCKIYSHAIPFNQCQGEEKDTVECAALMPCKDFNGWTEWSPFTRCTASCGRGFRFRNRTCLIDDCYGLSRQAESCNRHRCPVWDFWGPLSPCNTSCGPGYATRTRSCIFGLKCRGKSEEIHQCYSIPCNESANDVVNNLKCGFRPKSTSQRAWLKIINGKNAALNAWPWQGSWQRRINSCSGWKHFCGVSLIHSRWVVTAGHCFDRGSYLKPYNLAAEVPPSNSWSIVFGVNDIRKQGIRHFIYKIYLHKKYEVDVVANHDVALIKLTSFVTFTDAISPICLPGLQLPEPGQLCMVTGWGQTKPGSQYSSILQEASLPYVAFDDCTNLGDLYRDFLDRDLHMCAGRTIGNISDTCEGDSGGPLSCKHKNRWYLAGITSFSFADCGTPGHLGIYSNVTKYQNWIVETVRKNTYDN